MKIKLRCTLYLALCFIAAGLNVKAQTSENQYFQPQPFPRSPTATALEKYGTYQVNEFTGVPDISIPLYAIEAGGFQVPITLSYHAAGNKVTDVSSWVGLGWSVSSGGQISRRTFGTPDDGPGGYITGEMMPNGTIDYTTVLGATYLESAANGTFDTKPDIFSYDFPGHSGKFFFDGSAGTGVYPVRLLPYAPIKVQYAIGAHFNLTDEHGNRYLYGDAYTDSTGSSGGGRAPITTQSAWELKTMISQNRRDTVSFTYNRNEIVYPAADGETYTVTDQPVIIDGSFPPFYHAAYLTTPGSPGNLNVTTEQVPKQINFKNGKVVFDRDTSVRGDVNLGAPGDLAYGLNDIKIYDYNYGTKTFELQKTVVFWKSYFNPGTGYERLRLDSIQVLDKAGSIMQHYSFDYNTATALPDYTSKKQDYWGYFNNVDNSLLTPQQIISYQSCVTCTPINVTIGSDHANGRDCDSVAMQAFILTGIHYPSGGNDTFTYQTNQYTDLGTLYLAGGLRVKTISSYDGISVTPIVKTYVYNVARPNFNLGNSYFVNQQTHQDWESHSLGPIIAGTGVIRSYATNPHTDLEGYDGATVVYPSVTEYIGTPATNAGRTDYIFTDAKDTLLMASMAGNQIFASAFYRRGQLKIKKEYIHTSGTTYQMVKSTFNAYSALPASMYPYVGLAVSKTVYNEGASGSNPMIYTGSSTDDRRAGTFIFAWYNISSDDNYLTGTTTKVYDTSDTTKYTSSFVAYTYDDTTHQQVTNVSHTDSKGNTHITVTKHAYDYLSGGTTHNVVLDSMINRHMYADVVEKWDSLKNVATSVNAVIDGELNNYKSSLSYGIVPSTISTLSVLTPLTTFAPAHVVSGALTGDSRYVQMISFDNYDSNNNIIQYTTRNTTPVSIMWDYLGGEPIAQVKNAVTTNIAYTSFEADGQGNWTFSGAPLYDPTAPTGTMVYPLSSGSVTSPIVSSSIAYVASFWTKGGIATVTPSVGSPFSGTALNVVNGWTYYEYQIPSGTSRVIVSGSVSVDELRLYPAAAQMTTYAYDPSGVRSISDTKGSNSYFEYDFFDRLKNSKDWAGNIVKNYGYHMYNMTVGNQVQTASITRDNCPYGTTPGSLTYTVPANKYYSSTLASANAEASYDLNTYGQIKADINCGCPITYITITVTNTTGAPSYPIYFSGITAPYTVPTGPSFIYVPEGPYTTVTVGPGDSSMHNFTMGTRPPQNGVHSALFNTVAVTPGSSDLTITIN